MEKKGGMVAVVQGLQDSNLTVTLLDGGKQYTLMPSDHVPQLQPFQRCHPSVHCGSQHTNDRYTGSNVARNRENGIQATDGTYASTYKVTHCNLNPTSPPQTVTEFPPQKSEVLHGHGHFVVGGYGSGETAQPAIKTDSFRGGMVWPDKGSVCASRASMQSDAFASSLRKYPNITPERSSEVVQRLINFTQAKNLSKVQYRCPCSPTRNSMESDCSKQTFIIEQKFSKTSDLGKTMYQPEVTITNKKNKLHEHSPVREKSKIYLLDENDDSWNKPMFCKSNDVKCFRDTDRKVKQGHKNIVTSPTNPYKKASTSRIMEQYGCEVYQRRMHEKESKRSVNMEIQAAAQMESKEMLTLPRIVPVQRTVATPLSPIPSKTERRIEGDLKSTFSSSTELIHEYSCKSIQVRLPLDVHMNITSSSFDLRKNKDGNKSNSKRSRSEEDLDNSKKNRPNSILSLIQHYSNSSEINEIFSKSPISKKKRICENCKHLFDDFDILRRSVSNNTYFHEDFNFNTNQRTSKDFTEMSKNCHIHESNRINKDKRYIQQQLEQPEFLSYIDTRDTSIDANRKDSNKLTKTCNRSLNIECDWNTSDVMNKSMGGERCSTKGNKRMFKSNKDYDTVNKSDQILRMTPQEIKNLIDLDILAFTEKYQINITAERLYALIEELFDLFVMNINNASIVNKKNMSEKIKNILKKSGLSDFHSIYLTDILTEHWEEEFSTNHITTLNSSNLKSETLVVLSSIIQDSSHCKQDENNIYDDRDFSIKGISQKDIEINVEVYINKISNEINDWLLSLRISETQDEKIRLAIINDLATDIVDRHKYLELNASTEISEMSELEHLKYQIFKLIYKLGIPDMAMIDRAFDLMKRLQNIPVPIFSTPEGLDRKSCAKEKSKMETGRSFHKLKVPEPFNLEASSSRYIDPGKGCCKRPMCKRNLNKKGISETNSGKNNSLRESGCSYQAATSTRRMSSSGKLVSTGIDCNEVKETCSPKATEIYVPPKQYQNTAQNIPCNTSFRFSGGIKIRDEDDNITNVTTTQITPSCGSEINKAKYNQYLKDWVEKIPLPTTGAEDQIIARTEIYKGILDAVAKLRSERDTFNDRFLFEDKLDEEIEKLINKLPQSSELSSKKHILKVSLIEKTSIANDLMKSVTRSYKQELVDNLKGNLPKPTISENDNPDVLEIYEELQILNLVEDFIICSRYENEDPVVAETYRKKLVKCTEDFIQELKANHNKALNNIDTKLYLNDILDTLKKVPIPSNETIQGEADEILLSIEIQKWFLDLPLIENNDFVEQLHRRRLRNNLAKQILEIEKGAMNKDSMLNNSLKHEISQFLGKAPLQQGESLNINSMVDELIKRLQNMSILNVNDSKKVAFNESDYEGFSKNIPLCSTCTGQPSQNNDSKIKGMPSIKLIQKVDSNQQSYDGNYHNISKPLFEDLRVDQTCCKDLSQEEIPNYETFENIRPRSSSLKDDVDPHWYTLQESRRRSPQSNTAFENSRNQDINEQSNKSIQTCNPNEQPRIKHYHNIAKPLLDDLKLNSDCCNDGLTDERKSNNVQPRISMNSGSEPYWYTLQETKQDNFQRPNESFVPYPVNISRRIDDQDCCNQLERQNMPDQEFRLPQQYLQSIDPNHYAMQQRRDISNESIRFNKNVSNIKVTTPSGHQIENTRRRIDNAVQQTMPNPRSPTISSPRRHESPQFNQKGNNFDQVASPRQITHFPRSPKEPRRHISNHSPEFENIIEDQRSGSPPLNRSDLFYRSTDPDGIKRTIVRNSRQETNIDKTNASEHIPEYCQPSVIIPPCYLPIRLPGKENHIRDRNRDEMNQIESDEENDEEDEIQCRCVENMWKSKRRIRYCPFEQYDGYPMCVTSPYYYPYFY